jgi:preprotein translocase subunit SecD
VAVDLTVESAEAFREVTEAAIGAGRPRNQIAIIVDGEIVSSPTVVAPIENGALLISGGFSEQLAKSLAVSVNPID